jgi:hypothetical protein
MPPFPFAKPKLDKAGDPHLDPATNRVPHLRDGLIVAKVGIRATREPIPSIP